MKLRFSAKGLNKKFSESGDEDTLVLYDTVIHLGFVGYHDKRFKVSVACASLLDKLTATQNKNLRLVCNKF